mgnify:CR=1 FL=1
MYRIYSTLIEIVAAAVFIIPIWCIYNKLLFRSWKITILYIIFGFYLTAVLALVGFPNIISLKVELTVNIIPFIYMINDFSNACLNVLLFVPFGFFLPVLWKEFRNAKKVFIAGFAMTSFIEIAQIFTGRATDIDDIITNIAGTLVGYLIAYWFTGIFTRKIVKNSKKNDFYIICASVVLIMFFLQPFISSLLWELIKYINSTERRNRKNSPYSTLRGCDWESNGIIKSERRKTDGSN